MQSRNEVAGGDILLNAVAPAIEPALAPAGEIENGFAQCFRGIVPV